MNIGDEHTRDIRQQLTKNRERHFNATNRDGKKECRRHDQTLRRQLAQTLEEHGFDSDMAQKIAHWDPYDQNSAADWFNAEHMFGVRDGFDIVIGNPPYVQLQVDGGRLGKKYEAYEYKSFAKMGDIYMLFYERGIQLLRKGAYLCYITSNKWMRAGYGNKLRGYLAAHNPLQLLDFGGVKIFEAAVNNNILMVQNKGYEQDTAAVQFDNRTYTKDTDIATYVKKNTLTLSHLSADAWIIASESELALKEKIERVGTPLKEWGVSIYRGVTIGFNDAFIINDTKRDELIAADPKSIDILKPILRGRDIKHYQAKWAALYLITIPCGWTNKHRKTTAAKTYIAKTYPAVYAHLIDAAQTIHYKGKGLYDRDDQGDYWWELRACAYYAEFEKERIVWTDISSLPPFSIASKGMYLKNSAYMMSGGAVKYLIAILNSSLVKFYFPLITCKLGSGAFRWIKQFVDLIPIPPITTKNRTAAARIERIASSILATKEADPAADTTPQEKEIDQLVYQLYGLTKAEINIIEGA